MIDTVRTVKVREVVQESSNIRSLLFEDKYSIDARAGQFVMVWLPYVGEFPMSLSLRRGRHISSIVVKGMGEGTRRLYESKVDDFIGLRGPYGNHFEITRKLRRVLLVGGGTGMAPIVKVEKELREFGIDTRIVIGAKTKNELPFLSLCKRLAGADRVYPTTDDGSLGMQAFAHEQVQRLVSKFDFDCIFACGPEAMMYQTFKIAEENSIPVQFSLERIMKCGMAICGSCCIGDLILCRDGPVINSGMIREVSDEFGVRERDGAGRLVPRGAKVSPSFQ